MPALALQLQDDKCSPIIRLSPTGQGQEAVQMDKVVGLISRYWQQYEILDDTLDHWRTTLNNFRRIKELQDTIRYTLSSAASGYVSLTYIARQTGLSKSEAESFLRAYSDEFKKSFLVSKNGDSVYMLKSSYSFLVDAWNAFRHFNAMK